MVSSKRLTLACTLGLAQASATLVAQGNAPSSGWQQLQSLPAKTQVQVTTAQGTTPCHLQQITEEAIACKEASYPRAEVLQVRRGRRAHSTTKGLLIGTGVGVGVGAIVGATLGKSSFSIPGRGAAVGIAIFAPVGALAGALAGSLRGSSEVLYRR